MFVTVDDVQAAVLSFSQESDGLPGKCPDEMDVPKVQVINAHDVPKMAFDDRAGLHEVPAAQGNAAGIPKV